MKKILLLAIALLTITPALIAKDKDKDEEVKIILVKEENSDEYYYEAVVPVDGVKKEQIYQNAKKWVLTNLKTVDNNIQFDDDNFSIINSSSIILKPLKTYFSEAIMTFKLSLDVKDGKYKVRFDNIVVYMKKDLFYAVEEIPYSKMQTDDRRSYRKINNNLSRQANINVNNIAERLNENLKAKGNGNDW